MTLRPADENIRAKTVVLLGTGNVGTHLSKALRRLEGYKLVYLYGRSLGMRLEDIPRHADIYIYALSDTALPEVWAAMPETKGVWIHTAGSVGIEAMRQHHEQVGIIYPLQTFSKKRAIDWSQVPLYYEGHEEARLLAEALSGDCHYADSEGRAKLHLGAVLACNYSNHLISLAEEYLSGEGFDAKALMPLIRETFAKIEVMPARSAQTGPAIRGDEATIERHLSMLPEGRTREIYQLLAESIAEQKLSDKSSATR